MKVLLIIIGSLGGLYAAIAIVQFIQSLSASNPGSAQSAASIAGERRSCVPGPGCMFGLLPAGVPQTADNVKSGDEPGARLAPGAMATRYSGWPCKRSAYMPAGFSSPELSYVAAPRILSILPWKISFGAGVHSSSMPGLAAAKQLMRQGHFAKNLL
jgi:hypothetical protein